MTTVTIELPDPLPQEIAAKNITSERLAEAIVQFVELYVREQGVSSKFSEQNWSIPVQFTKGLASKHRKVF